MKTLKKMQREIPSLMQLGVTLPIGTQVITRATPAGIHPPTGALTGISAQQPLLGRVMGAGYTMGMMREAFKMPKKKKSIL